MTASAGRVAPRTTTGSRTCGDACGRHKTASYRYIPMPDLRPYLRCCSSDCQQILLPSLMYCGFGAVASDAPPIRHQPGSARHSQTKCSQRSPTFVCGCLSCVNS